MSFEQRISLALAERREKGQFRQRRVMAQSDARLLQVDGQRYLNFSGNDYLGLSHHPRVIGAWQQGAARYGVGAGGSGHVTGYGAPHRAFEQQLAEWLGYSHALLFISGFAANQAVITAMMAKNDRIFADKLAHASLLEAAALSPATLRRFAHNQPASLRKLLESTTHRQPASRHEKATHRQPASLPEKALHQQPELLSESTAHSPSASLEERAAQHLPLPQQNLQGSMACEGETLVVTEGVFSMDGDSAPLADLHQLTRQHGGWLMVDDAHGIGVTGEQGRGSCWQQQVRPELLVVTFGKAFGLSGAALLCDEETADYLLQFARHLIYSTAMPPAQACALQEALVCVQQGDDLRQRLQQNIQQFRQGAAGLPLTLQPSATAIQPLIVGDEARALSLAETLRAQGCWVTAIRPPTVPPGTARLRITLSAAHGPENIQRLLEVLHAAGA